MNPAFFLQRLRRIVTRPPEVIYALARHWLLILVFLVIGGSIAWAFAVNRKNVYIAKAQIVVTKPGADELLINPRAPGGVMASAFLLSQKALFENDDVIRRALSPLIPRERALLLAGSNEEENVVRRAARFLSEFLRLSPEEPDPSLSIDRYLDQSVRIFKETRMTVTPVAESNALNLQLLGIDREQLRKEIHSWIAAYRDEASQRPQDQLEVQALENRIRAQQQIVNEAKAARDEYIAKNQSVDQTLIDHFLGLRFGLQQEISELKSELRKPFEPPLPPEVQQRQTNQRVQAKEREIATLKNALYELERKGYTATHPEVIRTKELIAALETELEAIKLEVMAVGVTDQPDPDSAYQKLVNEAHARYKERQSALQAQIAEAESKLAGVLAEASRLSDIMERTKRLEARYEDELGKLRHLKTEGVMLENNPVLIELSDGPSVSAEPANINPLLLVFAGAFGGLFLGMLASLVAEAIHTRVRFKHDVIGDFGLPVLVVFPK